MPAGALITGAALLWLSQSGGLWQFYVTFGVMAAIGCATLHITPVTAVASNWFTRRRGTAISIVVAGPGAGQLLLLPFLQNLIERTGWRNTYLIFGAAVLTIPTILILLFLYSRPSDRGIALEAEELTEGETKESRTKIVTLDKEWTATDWTVSKALRNFRFWSLTASVAFMSMGLFLVSVHLIAYLVDKGYSSMLAASVMGVQGLINILGSLLGGMLADRIGREKTVTLGMIMFIGCIVLLGFSGLVVSTVIVYGFAIFFGVGFGMAFPALVAAAADLFQGKHFGSILGVIMLTGYFGGAIGSWLGGFFFDLTHVYRWNFLVAGALMLTSALLIWKAGPGQIRAVKSVQTS
jgi:MFS family permease